MLCAAWLTASSPLAAAALGRLCRHRQSDVLPVIATAAVYCVASEMPNAPLAFYIARGWLGCLFAWGLLRGWRITWLRFAAIASWEASSALCGSVYVGLTGVASLCDAGSGLPLTWPSLALTLIACIYGRRNG